VLVKKNVVRTPTSGDEVSAILFVVVVVVVVVIALLVVVVILRIEIEDELIVWLVY